MAKKNIKFLSKLSKKELRDVAYMFAFTFYSNNSSGSEGSSIFKDYEDGYIQFSSWNLSYSDSRDYEEYRLRINDFEIVGLKYKSEFQIERQKKYIKFMYEKFKKQGYKEAFENYVKDKKTQAAEKSAKEIDILEKML